MLFDGRGGGAGASNLVLLGRHLDEDRVVVKAAYLQEDPEEVKTLLEEIHIQRRFAHDNVVPLLYAAETPSEVLLVTPFASGGDLYAALGLRGMLPESEAVSLCSQLLEGLGYLHEELFILHGDLKPRNIFLRPVGSAFVAQLGDFGLSREVPRKAPFRCKFEGVQGTHGYMAPELLAHEDYGCPVDIFALGVIMFTLLAGYEPFYPASNVSAPLEFDPSCWSILCEAAVPFATSLLRPDPKERVTAASARSDIWLRRGAETATTTSTSIIKFHPAANVREALASLSTAQPASAEC